MSEIHHPEDLTWSYLRDFYYPRFRNSVTHIAWEHRYPILKTLYDHGSEKSWEERSGDPIADMMGWAARKGYWAFFSRGVTVSPDGSFTVHPHISRLLGRNGALGPIEDPDVDSPSNDISEYSQ